MSQTRMEKRNTLQLPVPDPDSPEIRQSIIDHNRAFGKTVLFADGMTTTVDVVAGQSITSPEPIKLETKDEDEPEDEPVSDIVETIESDVETLKDPEPEDEPVSEKDPEPIFPEDLICPHCGSKARSEASYLKNHGDSCFHKP